MARQGKRSRSGHRQSCNGSGSFVRKARASDLAAVSMEQKCLVRLAAVRKDAQDLSLEASRRGALNGMCSTFVGVLTGLKSTFSRSGVLCEAAGSCQRSPVH